jgi:hypothetical protein
MDKCRIIGVIAGTILWTVANSSCVDTGEVIDWTDQQVQAAEADEGLSALEAPTDSFDSAETEEWSTTGDDTEHEAPEGSIDTGLDVCTDSATAIEQGEVYLFLPEYHTTGQLEMREQAPDLEDQTEIPYQLDESGSRVRFLRPKGVTTRFVLDSERDGTLNCELKTEFDSVAFPVNFELGSVVLVPLSEGYGL